MTLPIDPIEPDGSSPDDLPFTDSRYEGLRNRIEAELADEYNSGRVMISDEDARLILTMITLANAGNND